MGGKYFDGWQTVITQGDYFGRWTSHIDATPARKDNAELLLAAVANFEAALPDLSITTNPITKTGISGASYGGFRPQSCQIGREHSAHKEGLAIDLYDPENEIDDYIDTFEANGSNVFLADLGLYREAPASTPGWCHLTIRPPPSHKRTFKP